MKPTAEQQRTFSYCLDRIRGGDTGYIEKAADLVQYGLPLDELKDAEAECRNVTAARKQLALTMPW